jgi:hypothetical protein
VNADGSGNPMGDWGVGNFENDYSRDVLADLMARWENWIETFLAERIPQDFPDLGFQAGLDACETYAISLIEVMIVVAERLDPDYRPSPETVERWRTLYLSLVDRDCGRWDTGPAHVAARKQVIGDMFDRLSVVVHCRD